MKYNIDRTFKDALISYAGECCKQLEQPHTRNENKAVINELKNVIALLQAYNVTNAQNEIKAIYNTIKKYDLFY